MKKPILLRPLLALLIFLTAAPVLWSQKPLYSIVNAFPNLVLKDCVTSFAVVPARDRREVAGLQRGLVLLLPKDRHAAVAPVFLDLRERLKGETGFEEGLHGIVFHPQFQKNRRFYVSYTQHDLRRTVISEILAPNTGGENLKADLKTERILLEIPHPLGFHWGGTLAFGPDGFLYTGIGDGGLRDDLYLLAQNPWALQGKILRINPDGRQGSLPYSIPADNPFTNKQEIRQEIWALGFRNPWGLSFDDVTGRLWVADVGQDIWEEINIVDKGGNYGWSEREGPNRFITRLGQPEKPGPYIDPVYSYPHSEGISITGGFVYRGGKIPSLHGQYLFGDWGHGKLWALPHALPAGQRAGARLLFAREGEEPRFNPTTIGPDAKGEVLIGSHYPPIIYTLHAPPFLAREETEPSDPGLNPGPVLPLDGEDDNRS